MRAAGLVDRLNDAGADVEDYGDVQGFRWVPDRDHPRAMHVTVVWRVALDVAERVAAANADGRLALVLGGDCAVGIGTYLGVRRNHDVPWLVYLDPPRPQHPGGRDLGRAGLDGQR